MRKTTVFCFVFFAAISFIPFHAVARIKPAVTQNGVTTVEEVVVEGKLYKNEEYLDAMPTISADQVRAVQNQVDLTQAPAVNFNGGGECSFPELAAQCEQMAGSAGNSCNKDSSQNQGIFGQFASAASGVTQQLSAMSASSVNLACSKIGQLSVLANSALTSFKGNCQTAQQNCLSACENYRANVSACLQRSGSSVSVDDVASGATSAMNTCRSYDQQVALANQSMQQTIAGAQNAANCAKNTSAGDYCSTNPTAPVCMNKALVASCDNAEYAATNVTCKCLKNPQDAGCGGILSNAGLGSGPSGGLLPTGDSGGGTDIGDLMDDGNSIDPVASSGKPGEEISGQLGGGGSPLGGGGAAGGAGSNSRNNANSDSKSIKDILSGFWGGGQGGAGGAGGLRGLAEKFGFGSGGSGGAAGAGGQPDLRKFLPGGVNDPRRRPASLRPDGINGSNANLFHVIKNAYNKQAKSLKD